MSTTKTRKKKDKIVEGELITLKSKVIVTDPCYSTPTWCQAVLSSVHPGKYHTFVLRTDEQEWGIRNSRLFAIHEEYIELKLKWEDTHYDIGVDSGQAGIFSLESYRNDKIAGTMIYPPKKHSHQWDDGLLPIEKEGDEWYYKICGMTINNEDGFGTYKNGVASRSGIGDGGYQLFVNHNKIKGKDKITALCIDFGLSEKEITNDFSNIVLI